MSRTDQSAALRTLLGQAELAGAQRRALLLHTDRLPPDLARAQHQRLARATLAGLEQADRAQRFELSRNRVAIVWRSRGGQELDHALAALDHLLADLPPSQAVPRGQLVTVYDLPDQGAWLLDELEEPEAAPVPSQPMRPLDPAFLARLEHGLAQADLSPFMRWRAVLHLRNDTTATAWEERYVAAHALAASLCPDRRIKSDPWLFQRLTRSFDQRLLTLLCGPRELKANTPFALHLHVASILSPEFLRFDSALPSSLRGAVILYLTAADILADPSAFAFAAQFAHARGYRLLLRRASTALLSLLDVAAACLDYVHVPLTQAIENAPDSLRILVPETSRVVLSGAHTDATRAWAQREGFGLVRCE
jgi:hypothetical protein